MSWQGANVERREKGSRDDATASAESDRRTQRSQETVEAALNRLSKAYSAAMHCMGAWYRAEKAHLQTTGAPGYSELQSSLSSLRDVGQAARRTFEEAILLDPLVADDHAPVLSRTLLKELKERGDPIVGPTMQRRSTVELRSAGHKATVEQLAVSDNKASAGLGCCRD
jgi:hypothetical protein